ncbi:interleukin-34 [Rhinophrynus dorsalis]
MAHNLRRLSPDIQRLTPREHADAPPTQRLMSSSCILVLGSAAVISKECQIIHALHDKLLYEKRLLYMGEYFPLDYKLNVSYEEVLRCQNISSLLNQGITVKELRYLWGIVNESVLLKMKAVLPSRHPSLGYVSELLSIFKELLQYLQEAESEIVHDILGRLMKTKGPDARKPVKPKALLDNCFKVLYALYEEQCSLCNPRSEPQEEILCPPLAATTVIDYESSSFESS